MVQSIISLILLGGTGIALLGGCLMQANGPMMLPLTAITVFFGIGFLAHFRSLRNQG